tara:strand:+ start:904 stop:1065 length:162 start_codon:yes stop_codon:yes gene_type:complete
MSLSGVEWQDLAVLSRYAGEFNSKENLTEKEKYVSMWLKEKIEILKEKKDVGV